MKTRWKTCAALLTACLLLGGCANDTNVENNGNSDVHTGISSGHSDQEKGDVSQVEKNFATDSPDFSEEEVNAAMDAVIAYFEENFQGCTLREIKYDKNRQNENWAQYGADSGIVLSSVFDVDENGGDGSFNPNETVGDNWGWILTLDENGEWTLRNYGYA